MIMGEQFISNVIIKETFLQK